MILFVMSGVDKQRAIDGLQQQYIDFLKRPDDPLRARQVARGLTHFIGHGNSVILEMKREDERECVHTAKEKDGRVSIYVNNQSGLFRTRLLPDNEIAGITFTAGEQIIRERTRKAGQERKSGKRKRR